MMSASSFPFFNRTALLQGGRSFSEADVQQLGRSLLEILIHLHSQQSPVIHSELLIHCEFDGVFPLRYSALLPPILGNFRTRFLVQSPPILGDLGDSLGL